ncbi:DUF7940 domain-containing protein [Massilia soli]|uniref:Holin n=1 Tax=Massilia soli TaxID=2792854 RepID=A0ABS7SR82_9BURK|nr:hypothetical protein [Massilia soli]MBZ2208462.1 hypothetical protein [Massilia soli]
MNIHLVSDWKLIAKKALSLKFSALALALTAAEVYVAITKPDSIPPGVFAIGCAVITLAAMAARVVAQKELSDE